MVKIGIFIIPNLLLKNKILKFKKDFKKQFGNATYLNHLPHCTLYVFKTANKNLKEFKKIKNISINRRKNYSIDKNDIFFNDPITKKNTYIIKLKKNNFLKNLQKTLLKTFCKYALKSNDNFKNNTMNQNFRLYGYPFINMNWKPHFTIGSISLKKNQYEFIKKFKKKFAYKKQFLNKIFLYKIKRNNHKLLCKINIK